MMLKMDRDECENISRRVHSEQTFEIYGRLTKIEEKLAKIENRLAGMENNAKEQPLPKIDSKDKERNPKK